MPITDLLERNSKLYGDETALVEINPELREEQRVTWKEYELIQPTGAASYRREITWPVLDDRPIVWPTCYWAGASARDRRWLFC